jgi:CubicO group peptidase (beta-lactamase class C family)
MDLSPDDVAEIMELSRTGKLLIISIHGNFLSPVANYGIRSAVIEKVRNLADSANVILTVFANPYMLEQFGDPARYRALVMAYEDMDLSQKFAAQMIFGSIPARGRLPVSSGIYFREGDGMNTDHYFRLKYSIPEECSMDGDILKGIDSIVLNAISKEAFPGCQVLVARNGVVVYHKAFGFHSYDRRQPVELNDIYDLASVTKIAGTLPCLMKLVDEKRVDLDQQLSAYLPALDSCNKGHLVIKEILSHKAGLQAWIPFYLSTLEPMNPGEQLIRHQLSAKYPLRLDMNTYVNRNIRYADSIYAAEYSSAYPIQVANHLFLKKEYTDTIFRKIYLSELSEKKEYKYSDLGFYFMMQIIETMTDSSLDKYVYQNFYKYLGTGTMGFLPLTRFPPDRIVPTENDLVFRRQLLQGYVHDMGAAMLGGVAGHAGLFSDANDLAKIMQMYLQKGFYGGRRFFSPETFDLFNTCYYCDEGIRRGLGFDKPEPDEKKEGPTCRGVSPESFGHSGFTGTFAWADPVSGILYVFLSNRIHPDQDNTRIYDMNVRTNIQQLIQNAVIQ